MRITGILLVIFGFVASLAINGYQYDQQCQMDETITANKAVIAKLNLETQKLRQDIAASEEGYIRARAEIRRLKNTSVSAAKIDTPRDAADAILKIADSIAKSNRKDMYLTAGTLYAVADTLVAGNGEPEALANHLTPFLEKRVKTLRDKPIENPSKEM